jgi:hypothetical protein
MNRNRRWLIALLAAALVVGMVVWARGDPHHHGIQIGSAAYSRTLAGGG